MNKKTALITALALLLTSLGINAPVARAADVVRYVPPATWQRTNVGTLQIRNTAGWGQGSGGGFFYGSFGITTIDGVQVNTSYKPYGKLTSPYSTEVALYYAGSGVHHVVINVASTWNNNNNGWSWTGDMVFPVGNFAEQPVEIGVPLSVALSGPSQSTIGVPYTATATAAHGTPPYRYLFAIDWVTELSTTEVYTGTLSSTATLTYTFTFVAHFQIRVTALDSTDAEATDTIDVNLNEDKPVLHGQLVDLGNVLNGDYAILYFTLIDDKNYGSPPVDDALAISTDYYSVNSPQIQSRGFKGYNLAHTTFALLPNPLVVAVSYTDPTTHLVWQYTFSFDTTGFTHGSWADSAGEEGGISTQPEWMQWIEEMLKRVLTYLFKPTQDQIEQLLPGGTLGATLLEGTTWANGATHWELTVHAGAIAIPLVDADLTALRQYTFVSAFRYGIDAAICMGLLYMIIILI